MRPKDWEISVRSDSVDVQSCDSPATRRSQRRTSAFLFAIPILGLWWLSRPDRYGYTLWSYLTIFPKGSREFDDNLVSLILLGLMTGCLLMMGLRLFFPSGETLHCNRETMTVSKIPWTSFRGRWKTRTFALNEVSKFRFGVVQSGRGNSTYGILFEAEGGTQKILAGIEAPEAHRILKGLKALGADYENDRDMRYFVRESLRDRGAQL